MGVFAEINPNSLAVAVAALLKFSPGSASGSRAATDPASGLLLQLVRASRAGSGSVPAAMLVIDFRGPRPEKGGGAYPRLIADIAALPEPVTAGL
jgi:hypothetical protein